MPFWLSINNANTYVPMNMNILIDIEKIYCIYNDNFHLIFFAISIVMFVIVLMTYAYGLHLFQFVNTPILVCK